MARDKTVLRLLAQSFRENPLKCVHTVANFISLLQRSLNIEFLENDENTFNSSRKVTLGKLLAVVATKRLGTIRRLDPRESSCKKND